MSKIDLETLRSDLIRLEETIIFGLIERAQFKQNTAIYTPRGVSDKFEESFLDFFLSETEKVHSRMRRYTAPDEHAFFPRQLLAPALPLLSFPEVIKPNSINFNDKVKSIYLNRIIPGISKEGDDQQYGSSANCDIAVLQAISKRVHYGKFVAEAKFQEQPEKYAEMIRAKDVDGLLALLVNKQVELKLLERVERKASTYGKDINAAPAAQSASVLHWYRFYMLTDLKFSSPAATFKVSPAQIVSLYKDYLIPLTIEIEIEYLLHRLDKPLVAYLGPAGTFSHQAAVGFFSNGVHLPITAPTETVAAKCDVEFQPVATIGDVFEAVLSNRVTYGVVPLENSIAGRVQQTMEQLYDTHAQIIGEQFLQIQHNLVARKGTDRSKVMKIYSHKQPLLQCENWLRRNFPNAELIEVSSTAKAAEVVSDPEQTQNDSAAICSSLAAERLGLDVLNAGIEDSANNVTRFLVLGKQLPSPSGRDHTIMTFGTSHEAGALSSALAILSKYGCNMFALESFPNKQESWKYNFFVELAGHVDEPNFKQALDELKSSTSFIRVLGCFRDQHPEPQTK